MPSNRRRSAARISEILFSLSTRRTSKPSRPRERSPASVNGFAVSSPSHSVRPQLVIQTPSHPSAVTSDGLIITLPVPPSINHQYASVNGRRVLSSTGRAYKALVGQQVWLVLAQSSSAHSLRDRFRTSALALSIRFFFSTSLRRDLDGGLKIAQDAICEGLGVNDNRIIETHLYKHVDKTHPRIEVSLSFIQTSLHHA